MKKVLAVLLLGVLAACGQQTSNQPEPKQQSNTEQSQPQTQQQPRQQPQQNTDQQDFSDYWNQLQQPFTALEGDVGTVQKLATEAGQDPSVLSTSDYQQQVQQACDQMNQDAQAILDIPESSNPKVSAIQDEVNTAVKQEQYVAQTFPNAVDTLNVAEIQSCTTAEQNAGSDFAKATQMVKDFKQQEGMN